VIKITNDTYFLPTIEALLGINELGSGTTKPMLIRGVCRTTQEKSDYVVKYRNAPRMSVESSCRELLASFIAMELDMNVAEPALINVSEEFVDSLRGMEGYKHANNSIGINYGSKFFGQGFLELLQNQKLNEKQFGQSEQIFALDILISNTDRRKDKQNMLTDGEKIMIFDHELAFGFVMDIIKNPTPWLISDSDRSWIKNHFFYPTLKENEHNFDTFVESFEVLDKNFWNQTNVYIPDAWKTIQVNEIKDNLTALINNKTIFLHQLYKVLS
jgi:hypothetical protein